MDKSQCEELARPISLCQLQVLEAVARQLSFTREAQQPLLTRPAVSIQIKNLENDIGLALTGQIGKTFN